MNARRAHTKSRSGCEDCRKRKVKCDEGIPCSSCVKRGDKCSLITSSMAASSSLAASTTEAPCEYSATPPVPPQEEVFTLNDIQLFHRFTSVTCYYLANPNMTSWVDEIPALSIKHPFLLHEVMALAAVDLSRDAAQPDSAATAYLEAARHHHAKALAGLMPAITSATAALVAPVWACNALFVPYYFATTANAAALLFTPEPNPGPAEWMLPLRGGVTLWRSNTEELLGGAMGPHLKPYQQNLDEVHVVDPEANPSDAAVTRMIGELQMHEGDAAVESDEGDERRVMTETFKLLRHCFRLSDKDDALAKKTASLTFCATVPAEFFLMLARKRTAPLVFMAFWCVLLHRAEKGIRWPMSFKRDRVKEMLGLIAGMLGSKRSDLIAWPLERVLGPKDVQNLPSYLQSVG